MERFKVRRKLLLQIRVQGGEIAIFLKVLVQEIDDVGRVLCAQQLR
jgi:hypothetical protein